MLPISLRGARTHHLQGVDLDLRPGELVVVTGVSGAGKSSLAFDTLYAEGQRRFVESFSPYVRQYLERLERPPVTSLEPIAAGIAVDRRATVKASRSTVATMADLEAYLSALFTRAARPACPDCGVMAEALAPSDTAATLIASHPDTRIIVTYAERPRGLEDYLDRRERLLRDGYRRLWLAGELADLDATPPSRVLREGLMRVVVDRVRLRPGSERRLAAALEQAWARGEGLAGWVDVAAPSDHNPLRRGLSCPDCGRAFRPPQAGLFSYQSALGACDACRGFGRVLGIDWDKVIPDERLSLADGAIRPWTGKKSSWERRMLRRFCDERDIAMNVPWGELSEASREQVIVGEGKMSRRHYPGLARWFAWLETKAYKMHVRVLLSRYRAYDLCEACDGKRLSPESLWYRVDGLDLGEWHRLEVRQALARVAALQVAGQAAIAQRELAARLSYLDCVGLGYLTLDRQARTLSGGEAQRVALTAALGTRLTGALFVLDEPTVGLHVTDLPPLVTAMRDLAARGNTVLVVEHDPQVIAAADRVIELGPAAGPNGGHITFDGAPTELPADSPTARALSVEPARAAATDAPATAALRLTGVTAHNLRDIDVTIPLGKLVALAGPSGSGKSTLAHHVLYRALARALGQRDVERPGEHAGLAGHEAVTAVELVDQSPLGRTSRGNAATYSGAWTRLRALLAQQPEAEIHDLSPSHFSFNVALGRCAACAGEGAETVEMQFLADVRLTCVVCQGKRFQAEVLAVRLHGRSVADLLAMNVAEALALFADERAITRSLRPLAALGLGYLPLGQPLSTLSGGEAQRLKLARALAKVKRGTLLIVDEPSAGLHVDEVAALSATLRRLVDKGASVLLVEHDPALLRWVDHVIELGPGAGDEGGTVVACCSPAELAKKRSRTAVALTQRPAPRPSLEPPDPVRAIEVRGAREHNLAGIDVDVPHGALVVVTGPSGAGKSSLAFDVVFAEGQRRFLETLTPYARQFLPMLPRPDVDSIHGIVPSVALEQRTTRAGAASTVATITEIAHYLRLLYAKVGVMHCPSCDEPVAQLSREHIWSRLTQHDRVRVEAPVVEARKGSHLEIFDALARAGFTEAICDGAEIASDAPPRLAKRKDHDIAALVFEGAPAALPRERFEAALALSRGQLDVITEAGRQRWSTERSCRRCDISLPELDPRWLSFNTKQGRCARCDGTGYHGGQDTLRELQKGGDVVFRDCEACDGSRLAPIPRAVRLRGARYATLTAQPVAEACAEIASWTFAGDELAIAQAAHAELLRRLSFVTDVGLGYLSLDRRAHTLSGGELQRLRLAAQLGAGLTGTLYVLDEPTIGLHPRDTHRLIGNLRALVDTGSTVLVVEHDADTIRAADHLIELGPSGGRGGGQLIASGPAAAVLASESTTAVALRDARGERSPRPAASEHLLLTGVRQHNLDIAELAVPAGRLVVVAGVSGSGKSTLVEQVLFRAVRQALGNVTLPPGAHAGLEIPASIERAIAVDQTPIGRTSRSVPATFLGIWDPIRKLFASLPEARAAGMTATRFSFNSAKGGRCPSCDGRGELVHEMAFLPDVTTQCEACEGARFEPGTNAIRYRGLSIGDVLRLSIDEATEVFQAHRKIHTPLSIMRDLGVGYVALGQGSPTLSGGEAQRLKLAKELAAGRGHRPTLYVLDEPTTGLHHSDVSRLLTVLDQLVERGDSLVVIEHHPVVMAAADHLIELGPEAGSAGGRVVATGTPVEIRALDTATGLVLRRDGDRS